MKKFYYLFLCLITFLPVTHAQKLSLTSAHARELAAERSAQRCEERKEEIRKELTLAIHEDLMLKSITATSAVNVTDSIALVALYNSTGGDNWVNNSNWLTGTVDTWYGIDVHDGRVVQISLPDNNLTNTLPSELGQLSQLEVLDLHSNNITGSIPVEIGDLSNLSQLDLGINQLTGSIPESLGQLANLETLFLGSGNNLSGEIPASLGNLSLLRVLAMDGNGLTGSIPSELGNMSSLEELYLQINELSGPIPENFQNLNLFFLDLGGNYLSGSIPDFLGQYTDLIRLGLWGNLFDGTIPESLTLLSNLSSLDLAGNQLTGPIPANIGQLSLLGELFLGWNQLSDTIPSSIGDLSNLFLIDLTGNLLSGSFPESLGNLSSLNYLFLAYNNFTGALPEGLCDLPVVDADFSGNRLDESSCAAYICLFNNGVFYDAYQTQQSAYQLSTCLYNSEAYCENIGMTGDFNNWGLDGYDVEMIQNRNDSTRWTVRYNFTQDGSVKFRQNQLWDVNWGGNSFPSGVADPGGANIWVPAGYYSITFNCAASTYEFQNLGWDVTSCSEQDSMVLVDLYNSTDGDNWINNENWLNGPVSSWHGVVLEGSNVKELWLDQNNLSDTLPASLGQLSQLETIAMGGNGFGGQIPVEIGNLSNLRNLWLWGNQLTGEIPASFGQLSNLNILVLNGNNLSGNIPTELGACNNLWVINLDWNFLDGEIPTELCNIENLSSVNFASNNFDAGSCATITCLTENGVSFADNPDQVQRGGYSLTNDCEFVADSTWVIFRVNMQNESVSPGSVLLNGSFSSWSKPVEMQPDSGSIYTVSLFLPAGQIVNYKFVNDGYYELPPSNCTTGEWNDREFSVPHSTDPVVLDLVCFGGCTNCVDNAIQQYAIHEIQGDADVSPLLGQTVRTKGRITAVNQYGFFIQDTSGVRSGLFVFDRDLATQFNQGDHIEIIAEVAEYNGKTELTNVQWFDYTDEYFAVYITEIEVSEVGEDYEGVFVGLNNVTVVAQNAYQEYIVVSESNDTTIIDNYLIQPYMEVGKSYIVYGIVDYEYGRFAVNPRAQGGILPLYDLTFRVDMQNEEVDPAGVFVGGDWNSWMSWEYPEQMTANGNVYTATIKQVAGRYINYKFKNGENWEVVPGACTVGDGNDRYYTMPYYTDTLDLVCFGGCTNCGDNSIQQYTIHEIQGDGDVSPLLGQVVRTKGRITGVNQYGFFMQDASGARNGIFVYDVGLAAQLNQGDHIEIIAEAGEYNGKTELLNTQWFDYTDEYFDVYTTDIEVAAVGEDYEGVFVRLNNVTVVAENAYQEYIVVSESNDTTIIGKYLMQPYMEVGKSYIVYGIVDYEHGRFAVNPRDQQGIRALYDLTFRVDMQNEEVDPAGVFVGGDWNSWMSWEYPEQMTANGSIYTATIKQVAGSYINYKFRNGEDWEIVLGNCSTGENGDRYFTMPDSSITLDLVCFNKCMNCESVNTLPAVALMVNYTNDNVCNGGATGNVNADYTVSDVGTVSDRGVIIGSLPNLMMDGTIISQGNGAGSFNAVIDNLEAGIYYLIAYAENENGIAYSAVTQFQINEPDSLVLFATESTDSTFVTYELLVSGGISPYTYRITVCDADSNCTKQGWQVDNTFTFHLDYFKNYEVYMEVADDFGCMTADAHDLYLVPDNTIQMDSLALVDLYNSTDGPNWTNNDNWLTGPLDTWYGVSVLDGRVTGINLSQNNLVGVLPPRIGKLSALHIFEAWGNQLTGQLPHELGELTSLVTLDLGINQFTGEIPEELGNLINLELLLIGGGNQLTGEIPTSLGQLSNLRILFLDGNQLTGVIPEELGNLSQLTDLLLQGNQLYGNVPSTFSNLLNLSNLFLDNNWFSGVIPVGLCNLPLQNVNFEQNYFNSYACDAIRCLTDNGVVFQGDPAQTQRSGIELAGCLLPSLDMIGLLSPAISNSTICNPSENETVALRFYNDGTEPVDSAVLMYILNYDTIAIETYGEVIYPGDTIDYEFLTKANLKPQPYIENFSFTVNLKWPGGMINGWTMSGYIDAVNEITDYPGWTSYNSCNGPANISYGIAADKDGNVWTVSNRGAYKFDGSTWEWYHNLNGLAEAANHDVYTDSRGFTWFSGINSNKVTQLYGTSFYIFELQGSFSSCIYEDASGNVWFGSDDGDGAAMVNSSFQWTYFNTANHNLGDDIISIGEDKYGILYFSSWDGITMFDGTNWIPFQIPLNEDVVRKIFLDSEGNTWFITYDKYIKYDGESNFTEYSHPDEIIIGCNDIAEDYNGNLWFGGGAEIAKYDGTVFTKYGVDQGLIAATAGEVTTIEIIDGDVWIGTRGGGVVKFEQVQNNLNLMGLVNPKRNTYPNYWYCGLTDDEHLTVRICNDGDFTVDNARLSLLVDGSLIGEDTLGVLNPGDTIDYTLSKGANFYHTDIRRYYYIELYLDLPNDDPTDNSLKGNMNVAGDYQDAPGWMTFNSCDGLNSDISWAITEDKNGDIWTTSFYGADRFDGSQWTNYTVSNGLAENYSWAIEKDSEGNVWFPGTEDSVITKYDGTNFTYYPQPGIFEECIYEDSQGNMWFGSWEGTGVARFDGQTWTYFMSEEVGFNGNITSIGEDVNGNIWVACNGTANFIFQYDGYSWQQMALPGVADGVAVSEIYYDSNRNTWFASSGLITQYDGEDWTFYANDNDVPGSCEDISEDIYGNIWFGGGRELVMFDGSEWTKYTTDEGLAAAQLGEIRAVYADSKGNVWVGTVYGGISKFEIPRVETCAGVPFQTGWNLFSTPVTLDSARVGYNFQSLIEHGSLVKIQDELGNAFEDPGIFGDWDDSEMKLIRPFDGFKINVSTEDSVLFCGIPVTYPYPIYLYEGWNIMGYPQLSSEDAKGVVEQLIDRGTLLKVQDEGGNSIEDLGVFGGWTNFIGDFIPGKGYKIKVSTRDTLWIYESYLKSTSVPGPKVNPVHFSRAYSGNGVDHMNLNIVDLPDAMLSPGDELAVYDGPDCVGAVSLTLRHLQARVVSIPVSASDVYGMPGFGEGNSYQLRLWKAKEQTEQILHPDIVSGSAVFTKHESAVLSLKNFTGIADGLLTGESVSCYPNPFNRELVIEANLANAKKVEIQVLNQLGQQVNYLLTKQEVSAGVHRWIWNGDNTSGQKVEPGMYYVRFSAEDTIVVNKVVMTK